MRKIEIVSLLLVLAAVGILIVSLQMDYGRLRSWMGMLFFALLILAMDPKLFRKKKQKHNIVDEPEETEEDETDFIELASAMPRRKRDRNLCALSFSSVKVWAFGINYLPLWR